MPLVQLNELLGQPEASEFLRGVVARGRYANAYLLRGPGGCGKGTAALAFARAILCEHGAPPHAAVDQGGLFEAPATESAEPQPPQDDACGVCAPCKKIAALQHPDLKFLFPVSGEERTLEQTVADTIEAWREDPYFVFTYEKAASIRLSLTRGLLRELAYKPFEADRRVVVVRDADRMREDQYSALLKSLEEPGAATVWILTTSRPNRLPATIRSRCQSVRFRPLAEKQVADFLEAHLEVPNKEARILAALSGGSLGRAIALREMEPLEVRDQALSLMHAGSQGDPAGLWRTVQNTTRYGKIGRESLRRMIEFQQLWLRDLLRARYDAPREALVHRDRHDAIRRQAKTLDATEIRRRLMVLEEVLRTIEGNVSADLALFSAMLRIGDAQHERAAWPRHPTGRWVY